MGKKIRAPKISTYYEPVECAKCGEMTNYIEGISVPTAKPSQYADDRVYVPLSELFEYKKICPSCFVKVMLQIARR